MARILVTGGLGFIGSHLVDKLVTLNHEVHVVDDLSTGQQANRNKDALTIVMPVNEFCHKFNLKYDKIFHLANSARIVRSFAYTEETLLNNYNSTVALCEYIRKTESGHLFFASSSTTEFTDPFNNPYTFSKHVCDNLLEFYRNVFLINSSVIKFYNVYGSMREKFLGDHTTIIRKFKQLVIENKPLTIVGDGKRTRDFTHIADTIDALIQLINIHKYEDKYHIGTGSSVSILEIAEAFDHPYVFCSDRSYELRDTLCTSANIPNWVPKVDVLKHIKSWRKDCQG